MAKVQGVAGRGGRYGAKHAGLSSRDSRSVLKRRRSGLLATSALVSALGLATIPDTQVRAADQYWNGLTFDADGTVHGGPGQWHPAFPNWTNDSGSVANYWTQGNTAIFAGTGGYVGIDPGAAVSVGGMQFLVDGYDLSSPPRPGANIELAGPGQTAISVASGATAMIGAVIGDDSSGSGGLVKTGTGTLVLRGNSIYNGTTTVAAGTLVINNSAGLGSSVGGTVVSADATLELGDGVTIADSVSIIGIGMPDLAPLAVSTGMATVSGNVNLTGDARIHVGTGAMLTIGGTLGGTGTIYKNTIGRGTLVLTANNSASIVNLNVAEGALQIADQTNLTAGTLTLNTGNTSADGLRVTGSDVTISKNITAGFSGARVTNDNTVTLSGVIGGGGSTASLPSFTKAGAGKLILTGNNTWAVRPDALAGTQVLGGTLSIASGLNLGSGAIRLNGGGLEVTGTDATLDRNITLQANGTIAATSSATLSGIISGSRNLTKAGSGTLSLSGANTYTGTTTISAGTLSAGAINVIAASSALTLADVPGALFELNGFAQSIGTLSGGGLAGGGINLGTADLTVNQTANAIYSGAISGTGSVTKSGSADLKLVGYNDYAGTTTISAGTLTAGHDAALGATAGGTFVASGAALQLDGDIDIGTEALELNGIGVLNGGALRAISGAPIFGGAITLASAARINSDSGSTLALTGAITGTGFDLTVGGGGDTSISSVISTGTGGLTKDGTGKLVLSAANTYQGTTNIDAGTLALSGAGSIAASSNVVVDGTLDISGTTSGATVNNLSGTSQSGVLALGDKILTVLAQGPSLDFAGSLSGSGTLIKQGSGTFTLSGDNSGFTGTTQVATGSLLVGNNGGTSSGQLGGNVSVASGATLEGAGGIIGGSVSVATGATLGWTTQGSNVGGLRMGALTMAAGAITSVNLGSPAGGIFTIDNDATVNGTLNLESAPANGAGVYRVFSAGGALTDNGLALGQTQGGYAYQIDSKATTLDVVVTALDTSLQYWSANGTTRGGAGTWTASNQWLNASGGASAWGGQVGVFDGIGGIVAVEGTQGFSTLEFLTYGYNVAAGTAGVLDLGGGGRLWAEGEGVFATVSAPISGTGALTKTGAGTIVLSGDNTYQGGTVLQAGRLQVSSDANLGAASGTLTFEGGELETTTSFASARNVVLSAGGTITPWYDTTLTLAGTVSGAGGLTVESGTVVLLGNNTYEGGTTLRQEGTVQIASDANLGAASGGLTFDNGTLVTTASFASARAITLEAAPEYRLARAPARGGGKIDVATGTALLLSGTVTGGGDLTKLGSGTLTLSGTNSYSGGTTISAGTLVGSAASFGTGSITNEAELIIDQSVDAQFANAIDGTGSFTKRGAGNLNLTGTGDLSGPTTVEAGKLSVNGSLANSAVTVLSGAAVGGSGTVGALTVKSGGIVAPGNSIGTLTVTGDLLLAPGSTFQAEIAGDGGTDQIAVSGKATVTGSNVTITALDPQVSYQQGQRYSLISAAGGVDGSFAGVTSSSAFLDLVLDPRTGEVGLAIAVKGTDPGGDPGLPPAPPTVFQTVAQTRNQLTTSLALNTLPQVGGTLALYNSLLMLDAGSARAAFDLLSGEIHASAKTALVEESSAIRSSAIDRLRSAFGSVGSAPMPTMSYGFTADLAPGTTGPMPALRSDRFAVWGQGYGSWGRTDADHNAGKLTRSSGGFLIGADAAVFDTMRVGLVAGYSHSEFDAKGRLSYGESDNYHLGLYGGGQWGALGLRLGASYTWHDVSTRRTVAFAGFGDNPRAGYDAGTAQVFGEIGYRIDLARIALEPFAGLAYVNLHTDGFSETGAAAALAARGDDTSLGFSTLGLRASTTAQLGGMDLTLRGALAWRHAFGDVDPAATLAFAGSTPFSVAGVPIAKNAALVEAGLDLAIGKATTLGLSYTGQLSQSAQDHAFKANLAVRF